MENKEEQILENKKVNLNSVKSISILILLICMTISIISFLFVTCFIWIPLLIMNFPLMLIIFLIFKYTTAKEKVLDIYYKIYDYLFYKSDYLRKLLWQLMYDMMVFLYPQIKWKCMNYGYADINKENGIYIDDLQQEDEYERYPLQMYKFVASCHSKLNHLHNLTIFEVGSGRGGGLEYLTRTMKPKKSVGIDYSQNQVDFCQQAYALENLSFFQGDSEKLDKIQQLKEIEVDIIINIESSHCYGNFQGFVLQVTNMLKQGGYFSISDFRDANDLEQFENDLTSTGLKIVEKKDITPNILKALAMDEQRKIDLIDQNVNVLLRGFFKKFSGLKGSRINQDFLQRKCFYMAYVLQKV